MNYSNESNHYNLEIDKLTLDEKKRLSSITIHKFKKEVNEFISKLHGADIAELIQNLQRRITFLENELDQSNYKLSCLISRLTGGLYSKSSMKVDEIIYEHDAWHEREDEKEYYPKLSEVFSLEIDGDKFSSFELIPLDARLKLKDKKWTVKFYEKEK